MSMLLILKSIPLKSVLHKQKVENATHVMIEVSDLRSENV